MLLSHIANIRLSPLKYLWKRKKKNAFCSIHFLAIPHNFQNTHEVIDMKI